MIICKEQCAINLSHPNIRCLCHNSVWERTQEKVTSTVVEIASVICGFPKFWWISFKILSHNKRFEAINFSIQKSILIFGKEKSRLQYSNRSNSKVLSKLNFWKILDF